MKHSKLGKRKHTSHVYSRKSHVRTHKQGMLWSIEYSTVLSDMRSYKDVSRKCLVQSLLQVGPSHDVGHARYPNPTREIKLGAFAEVW